MKLSRVIAAIKSDISESSGWVRPAFRNDRPKDELFILIFGQASIWIRANGSWVSGHEYGVSRFGYRPNPIGRWRLRRVIREWDRVREARDHHLAAHHHD